MGTKCKGYHWHNEQRYGQLKSRVSDTRLAQHFDIYTKP